MRDPFREASSTEVMKVKRGAAAILASPYMATLGTIVLFVEIGFMKPEYTHCEFTT